MRLEGHPSILSVSLTLTLAAFHPIDHRHVIAVKSMDDQCPVCKSDRYLNPKLRLLVSSCYHKMCVARDSLILLLTELPRDDKV